jgi:regulator of sigma E protease
MNFVLAILLYSGVYYSQGIQFIPGTVIGEVLAGSAADSCGVESGDEIVAINGVEIETWPDLTYALREDPDETKQLTILRSGDKIEIDIKGRRIGNRTQFGFGQHVPATIGEVKRDGPAYRAGMREGVVIDAINDTLITSFYDVERIIHANADNPIAVRWTYQGETRVDTLVPEPRKVPKDGSKTETKIQGQIGIGPYYVNRPVGFFKAVQTGVTATLSMTSDILSFLKLYFTGRVGLDSVGGPILITQMAGEMARWGFEYLLSFLAFFSINLCIFNLLPILPFDGGHLSLFIFEGITRRQVNRRVREILAQVGFALIILLMTFVVIIDISRCTGTSPGLF